MKNSLKTVGFLQALGLGFYVIAFASLAFQLRNWAEGKVVEVHPVLGVTLFLLAFVTSALISASIIFAYPVLLFSEGRKADALKIVFWSVVWLIVFSLIAGAGAFRMLLFP